MSSPRVRKVADRIQVIVAEMLERRIKDPRLGFVTVTDVRVTGDTQIATVFYTVLGESEDLASTVAEIQQRVKNRVELPEGYFVEYAGQFESQQRATFVILILAAVSLVGMFVVLLVLYPSVRIVLQIPNALRAG